MNQFPLRDIRNAISGMNITDTGDDKTPGRTDPTFLAPPWKDITTFLDEATKEMEEGELVHLQSFTLFDAMSAIEIMDPRMDTGMVMEDNESKGTDYDINQMLSPSQVLWMMDRLLACEMAWLSGHSLAQTVYTCIYFHHVRNQDNPPSLSTNVVNLDLLMQAVFRAYMLGSVKTCHHIWNEMISGNIYEEEDFTTNLFGLSLYDDISDTDVMNELQLALRMLKMYMDSNKSQVIEAIHQRLLSCKLFLQSLLHLAPTQSAHLNEAQQTLADLIKQLDPSPTDKSATSIFDSLELGQEVKGAFDPNINRKFTSQAPPRTVSLPTHEEAYQEFILIIKRLESICTIFDPPSATSPPSLPSVASLMNFFARFAGDKPYPDAFSRSKLNSLFYSEGRVFGTLNATDLVTDSILDYVQLPQYWLELAHPDDPKPLADAKLSLRRFLDQNVALPFVDFFKIQCHNRARQRRILCKVLGEWEGIQEEALHLDRKFQDAEIALLGEGRSQQTEDLQNIYHFSLWAYNMKMKMMEQILLLGFELDLYGDCEYATIYWYHWYLQSVLERCYERQDQQQHDNKVSHAHYSQQLNSIKKDLSIGTFKLLLAAKKAGQWKLQQLRFDDPETRFNHRLKPFTTLTSPPFQGYDRFLQDSATDHLQSSTLLNAAAEDFSTAKKSLEGLLRVPKEVSRTELCHDSSQKVLLSMVKTCVANNIVIQQLLKNGDAPGKKVTLAFKYHPWWPIMQLEK
ncbi:Mak10 subunit, NatC N-terminal acetyltransferase-domain-containing protein [Chlamydoabsidia padenii]|nr:Mak10 subunit, NatC N-terminal acetyltransferase-domain-containing protein [Chlamydoabsidia padenii]